MSSKGIKKSSYHKLTEERKEFLKQNYVFMSDELLARLLGYKDGVTVRKVRQLLGLKRDVKSLKATIRSIPIVIWVPKKYTKEN